MSNFYKTPLRSDELYHYGRSKRDGAPGPGSGRYPLGSGKSKLKKYFNTVKSTVSPEIRNAGNKVKETYGNAKNAVNSTIDNAKRTSSFYYDNWDHERGKDVAKLNKAQRKLDKYNDRRFFKTESGVRRRQQAVDRMQGRIDVNDQIKRASRQADIADNKQSIKFDDQYAKMLRRDIKAGPRDHITPVDISSFKAELQNVKRAREEAQNSIKEIQNTPLTHLTEQEQIRINRGKTWLNENAYKYFFNEDMRVMGKEESDFWKGLAVEYEKEQAKKTRR